MNNNEDHRNVIVKIISGSFIFIDIQLQITYTTFHQKHCLPKKYLMRINHILWIKCLSFALRFNNKINNKINANEDNH